MLLEKDKEFWCSYLKDSCKVLSQIVKDNIEQENSLSDFVWFENGMFLDKNERKDYQPFQVITDSEFVWFENDIKSLLTIDENSVNNRNIIKPFDKLVCNLDQQFLFN